MKSRIPTSWTIRLVQLARAQHVEHFCACRRSRQLAPRECAWFPHGGFWCHVLNSWVIGPDGVGGQYPLQPGVPKESLVSGQTAWVSLACGLFASNWASVQRWTRSFTFGCPGRLSTGPRSHTHKHTDTHTFKGVK